MICSSKKRFFFIHSSNGLGGASVPYNSHFKCTQIQGRDQYEQREKVLQTLRVWLRYRSAKDFGEHRTPPQKCVNA